MFLVVGWFVCFFDLCLFFVCAGLVLRVLLVLMVFGFIFWVFRVLFCFVSFAFFVFLYFLVFLRWLLLCVAFGDGCLFPCFVFVIGCRDACFRCFGCWVLRVLCLFCFLLFVCRVVALGRLHFLYCGGYLVRLFCFVGQCGWAWVCVVLVKCVVASFAWAVCGLSFGRVVLVFDFWRWCGDGGVFFGFFLFFCGGVRALLWVLWLLVWVLVGCSFSRSSTSRSFSAVSVSVAVGLPCATSAGLLHAFAPCRCLAYRSQGFCPRLRLSFFLASPFLALSLTPCRSTMLMSRPTPHVPCVAPRSVPWRGGCF